MKKTSITAIIIIAILGISTAAYLYINYNSEEDNYEQELENFKLKVRQDLKKYNMIKRIKSEQGEDRGILEPEVNFTKPEKVSHYQNFVTPNHPAVTNYVQTEGITSITDAYEKAVQWTWVSDITLHNKGEWWLKPKVFIKDTPNKTLYPNNPVEGMASDCESQAYTLVSIIENTGFSKENVRVAIGEVIFSGQESGHAWVQVYENGNWYELEATSGPYWDDDTNTYIPSSGVGINYFKTRPYPVERYIAFFNDIYYYHPESGLKTDVLPSNWYQTEQKFGLSYILKKNKE